MKKIDEEITRLETYLPRNLFVTYHYILFSFALLYLLGLWIGWWELSITVIALIIFGGIIIEVINTLNNNIVITNKIDLLEQNKLTIKVQNDIANEIKDLKFKLNVIIEELNDDELFSEYDNPPNTSKLDSIRKDLDEIYLDNKMENKLTEIQEVLEFLEKKELSRAIPNS